MGQSTLDNVPPEIKKEILDHLPRADLPAARLVNKDFACIAAPRLFEKIPLWISIKSLESLTNLAHHPTLRGHVKEIVFSPLGLIVPKYHTTGAYLQYVKFAFGDVSDPESSAALGYGRHSLAYHAFVEAQRYLMNYKRAMKPLTQALRQFDALKSITLSIDDDNIGSKELIGAFGKFNVNQLLSFDGVHTLPVFMEALAASEVEITAFTITWSPMDFYMRYRPMRNDFVGALLRVCLYSENYLPAFRALRTLIVAPYGPLSGGFNWERAYAKSIGKIIASAELLEVLEMEELNTQEGSPDSHRTAMSDLFEPWGLSRLRSLDICSIDATLQQLTDFFQQRPTLANVKLRSVKCRDAKWPVVLDRLRSYSYPKLQSFTLYYYGDWDSVIDEDDPSFKVDVSDYLLHKTDRNPWPPTLG